MIGLQSLVKVSSITLELETQRRREAEAILTGNAPFPQFPKRHETHSALDSEANVRTPDANRKSTVATLVLIV